MSPPPGAGVEDVGDFDRRLFISTAGEERFLRLRRKTCITERGMFVDPSYTWFYDDTMGIVQARCWIKFVDQPTPGAVALVAEFYANLPDMRNHSIYICGQWVRFDADAINRYYALPSIPLHEDQYHQWLNGDQNLEEIIQRVCVPGSQWTISKQNKYRIHRSQLTRIAKAWMYFLAGKLIPIDHFFSIDRTRVLLLYAILQDLSIDVGRIIWVNMRAIPATGTHAGLPHPSLITDMCRLAGVQLLPSDALINPKALITGRVIAQYDAGVPAPGADIPQEAQDLPEDQDMQDPLFEAFQDPPEPPQSAPAPAADSFAMDYLVQGMSYLIGHQQHMATHLNQMSTYEHEQVNY